MIWDLAANFADWITLATFMVAAAIVLLIPSGEGLPLPTSAKLALAAAFGVYVFCGIADVLDTFFGIAIFDPYEDFVELLFLPFLIYAVQMLFDRQLYDDANAQRRAMQAQRDLTLSIFDTAPSGILVLDRDGSITIANETAKEVLELLDSSPTGGIRTPGWAVIDEYGVESDRFSALVGAGSRAGVPLTVRWPDGKWRLELEVSVSPLDGSQGTVAAFPVPSRAASR